jgi:hypothetical protein
VEVVRQDVVKIRYVIRAFVVAERVLLSAVRRVAIYKKIRNIVVLATRFARRWRFAAQGNVFAEMAWRGVVRLV